MACSACQKVRQTVLRWVQASLPPVVPQEKPVEEKAKTPAG